MAWSWRGKGGGWAGQWPGRGPFSYLPPWQRPGWLFGFGRRFGRWLWSCSYNPWVYARFPWLPRWWWEYPRYWSSYAGYAWPYIAYSWGYPYWLPTLYMPYYW